MTIAEKCVKLENNTLSEISQAKKSALACFGSYAESRSKVKKITIIMGLECE
jgi:hypothetical protein